MNVDNKTLADLLVKEQYIEAADATMALESASAQHVPLGAYLIDHELLTKDLLGQALAEYFRIPYTDLNSYPPKRDLVLLIPEDIAKQFHVVVVENRPDALVIATDDPSQNVQLETTEKKKSKKGETIATAVSLETMLNELFGRRIILNFSLTEDIEAAFVHYRKALDTRLNAILQSSRAFAPDFINAMFEDALSFRASDIHIEPQAAEVIIRFRVDGAMQEVGRIPKQYYDNLLNRLKVLAQLRIDEHAAMQDGSISHKMNGRSMDVRVSIAPTMEGEKVVMRLLNAYISGFSLSDIGLSKTDQDILLEAANRPFGMLLVTGPTGSGKTTTLNALLKLMNTPDVNITTIEDPVEYRLTGVNQIQVNTRTDITFAKGLRSIVRQDPDIILVGEIRDQETAEIAVNAALTGHILFSTFHANDAPTAIPRLLDMGIEPFLLASTLNLVIAQRLVRKICEQCRASETVRIEDIAKTLAHPERFFGPVTTLYRGAGCQACTHTGYKGRTSIFEMIRVTRELSELMLSRPSAQQIWELARSQGAKTLFEDGIEKVKSGMTTLEELMRVASPPNNNS